jgi:GABA(A) receptor-associated protein
MVAKSYLEMTDEEKKKEAAKRLRAKTDSVPLILLPQSNEFKLEKEKYIVPKTFTFGQVVQAIRHECKLTAEQALFFFIDNQMPPNSVLLSQLYEQSKDAWGMLIIKYACENVFGCI